MSSSTAMSLADTLRSPWSLNSRAAVTRMRSDVFIIREFTVLRAYMTP